ncbi:MAG: hypothetical protein DWQ34_01450 [Planctomycetota bacterium]|nr:MAG: hypothetical protein DWQ34_01450 [Planctomycetota bacterium]REK21347.1 MAG: hypothetical protein DWQ41_21910 [Planctomycetota bacterium]REK35693.1 MAG: hypothetical protein DWQ45_11125 [Planctomycetota bacterium]
MRHRSLETTGKFYSKSEDQQVADRIWERFGGNSAGQFTDNSTDNRPELRIVIEDGKPEVVS